MKFQLLHNLGLDDARHMNDHLGASLSLNAKELEAGSTIDLPEKAVAWLKNVKGYTALIEPSNVKGESKKAELTAPAK